MVHRFVFGLVLVSALPSFGSIAEAAPLALAPLGTASSPVTKVEYFCSPGFEPGRNGTCVAVASRAEIELYVDQPIYDGSLHYQRRVRRHRRLRTRY